MRFSLNNIKLGVFEILFALYPILIYYSYGFASAGQLLLIGLGLYVLFFKRTYIVYKPLLFLLTFIILHEILLVLFFETIQGYYINYNIEIIINILSIGLIVSVLNVEKLYNAFILIGIFLMIALVYHFIKIYFFGHFIQPIHLPFLPRLDESSRYSSFYDRPVSFFPEPASYVSYMLIPLFWSLLENRLFFSLLITLTILLSSSTNGYFLSSVLWLAFILNGSYSRIIRYSLVFSIIAGVFIVYNLSYFDQGKEKIENITLSENVRIVNGPNFYFNLPLEHQILGIDAPNVNDYLKVNSKINQHVINYFNDIYLSTFWLILSKFGIFGLLLYLNIYFVFFKSQRYLRPFIITILLSLFSQSLFFSGGWVAQIVLMLLLYNHFKNKNNKYSSVSASITETN